MKFRKIMQSGRQLLCGVPKDLYLSTPACDHVDATGKLHWTDSRLDGWQSSEIERGENHVIWLGTRQQLNKLSAQADPWPDLTRTRPAKIAVPTCVSVRRRHGVLHRCTPSPANALCYLPSTRLNAFTRSCLFNATAVAAQCHSQQTNSQSLARRHHQVRDV